MFLISNFHFFVITLKQEIEEVKRDEIKTLHFPTPSFIQSPKIPPLPPLISPILCNLTSHYHSQ